MEKQFHSPIFVFIFTLALLSYSQQCYTSGIPQHNNLFVQEKLTLLQISNEWGNPPALDGWSNTTSLPYCHWTGIECTHHSVTAIGLDGALLGKPIPESICNLNNLSSISLSYCNIPGTFPVTLYRCSNLQFLDLEGNHFVGTIPSDINNLSSQLTHLNLAVNFFHDTIPASIWNLEKLQYLDLHSNNFGGQINGPGAALGLQQIDLSMNQLTGVISEDFGKLQNLTYFFLQENELSGEIPASIGLLQNLIDLSLFNNNLTGVLPPELRKHSQLQNLEVYNNRISGQLPEHLCANQALTYLIVSSNSFTGGVPSSVANCSSLFQLELYDNKFSGNFPLRIWSAAQYLETVIISNNSFTGTLPDNLPITLGQLGMDNNQLSGRIPSSAQNLFIFKASNNLFSGELPTSISMDFLQTIYLSHNHLVGNIPASIGLLPNLIYIDLSYNQLSGRIPKRLFKKFVETNFFGNPGLCSMQNSVLNQLSRCQPKKLLVLFLLLGCLLVFAVVKVAIFLSSSHARRTVETNDIESLRRRVETNDIELLKFISFSKLNFNENDIEQALISSNSIGRGGSGEVFKVTLANGAGPTLAVKKIFNHNKSNRKLEKQFEDEVKVLSSIRHLNIVQLLCCMESTKSRLVVYEYVENGNLNEWIKGKKTQTESGELVWLDWPKRLKIAVNAAEGLCYMHHHCAEPIVHRDVKSTNILLDKEFGAKIADFGLARMLDKDGEPKTVSCLAGTFGYIAPECAYLRKVNEKMDVYSFGVVLLELTTGRTPNDCDGLCIADWALQTYCQDETLMTAIDRNITDNPVFIDEIKEMLRLGLHCTARSPLHRPSMKVVVQWLKKIQGQQQV